MSIVAACAVAEEIPGIPPRARVALHDFARLITEHHDDPDLELSRRIQVLVDAVGIMNHLRAEGPEGEDRVRNVEELIAAAAAFGTEDDEVEEADPQLSPLALFLQQISLLADVDRLDSGENSVSLMTLHSAKGLEFPIVYLTGAEERLLPLVRPDSDLEQLEEERRLFYVGVTRAEDALTISWALRRRRGGSYQDGVASSFLLNIPRALLTHRRCGWWARRRDQRRMFTGHGDRGPQQSQQFQTAPTRYSPGVGAGRRRDGAATAREMRFPDVEDESQEAPVRLVKGSRVRHQHFGSGMVRGLSGFGLNVRVEVEFDEGGRKTLLVRKAKLESDWP